ncbi:MAG: hypothetical protein IT204_09190 [Fimbriimonadaceae bacterium]|nr:hypothetical protein [Fimbriimonadaceae bacterium]
MPRAWQLVRVGLSDPAGAAWPRLLGVLDELADPWGLPDQRLREVAAVAWSLGWATWDDQPRPVAERFTRALVDACALAARLRLSDTLGWLLRHPARPLDAAAADPLRAVAALRPDWLPAALPERPLYEQILTALHRVRRYGPAEADVTRLLAAIIGRHGVSGCGLRWWLLAQTTVAAAWVTLCQGTPAAAAALVGRHPWCQATWVGYLATSRAADPAAAATAQACFRLAQRATLSDRVVAPLRQSGGEPDAVAWWRCETAGWGLVERAATDPTALAAVPPGVLSGAPRSGRGADE